MAHKLMPVSDIEAVWRKMEKMNLEDSCFDIIREEYEAIQQKKRLNDAVEKKQRMSARKM